MPARQYHYHPAPLSPSHTVRIGTNDVSSGRTGKPPTQHVWYNHLTEVRFVVTRMRYATLTRIDLVTESEVGLRLGFNRDIRGLSFDPSVSGFGAMVFDLVGSIEAARPDLKIKLGEGGFWTTIWFVLGLVATVMGGGLLFFAIDSGVSLGRMLLAGPVLLGLAAFGLLLMWYNHPWRKRPELTYSEFRTFLIQT